MPNYKFGKTSLLRLVDCHTSLHQLMTYALEHKDCPCDFTIVCGHRNEADQNKALADKVSKAKFGESPHNYGPSFAVDVAPYILGEGIPWNTSSGYYYLWRELGEHINRCADELKIDIIWGADWDDDGVLVCDDPDESLMDLPHWELKGWRELK